MLEAEDGRLRALLQETVAQHVAPDAVVDEIRTVPLASGLSGAPVRRHRVGLRRPDGGRRWVRLVTKAAQLVERRVLARLGAQGHTCVPFSHTLDLTTDAPAWVCMEDVGDRRRPTSREPLAPALARREAAGLAGIHAANLGTAAALPWLPRTDRAYFTRQLARSFWPAWTRAVADPGFRRAFGPAIGKVETAAAGIVEAMAALAAAVPATLVHTDLNPSNVLVRRGRPYLIDWQVAHAGPLHLDLPHHLHTLALAGGYRRALAARGVDLDADAFVAQYRTAARYTALRYLWWTLEAWHADPGAAVWVDHYVAMLDDGLGAP